MLNKRECIIQLIIKNNEQMSSYGPQTRNSTIIYFLNYYSTQGSVYAMVFDNV